MRILIVEDDKNILDFLKSGLKSNGFAVDAASDGEKGSFMGRVNEYDLIILDLNLPGKNGEEICLDIRNKGKKTPILMLTVNSDTDSKIRLLNSGADDYLTKPFSFDELTARIKALLRRPPNIEPNTLQADDLVLNKNNQTVFKSGKEITLTTKEFSILEHLMKNKGRVVSRSDLMEHVWDCQADPFSNAIETHILNIRNKIGHKGKIDLIKTISGRGYKIE